MRRSVDVLVVGAGVVGLAIARALAHAGRGRILVVEKEPALGRHASGRSSGVVHAGIYYTPGSLKARLAVAGATALRAYARERSVRYAEPGKLILPATPEELPRLDELYRRGRANGVELAWVDRRELAELEPAARPVERALWSPRTGLVDALGLLEALRAELVERGVEVRLATPLLALDPERRRARLPDGWLGYGLLVNAAGVWADRWAHRCGVGHRWRILPFRGSFRWLRTPWDRRIRRLLYPVPDPELPFLGVHLTPHLDGGVRIGPTAVPALGREHLGGLRGLQPFESLALALRLLRIVARDRHIRNAVVAAVRQGGRRGMARAARRLVPALTLGAVGGPAGAGIRAQLYDVVAGRLVFDFVVERSPGALHVLNAVSPALTAALAFGTWVAEQLESA